MAAATSTSATTTQSARFALTQLRPGQVGVVRSAGLCEQDAALLGAMGLRCDAKVRLCRAGEPCIVAITSGRGAGCRIGLARPLADKIVVDVLPRGACGATDETKG